MAASAAGGGTEGLEPNQTAAVTSAAAATSGTKILNSGQREGPLAIDTGATVIS